MYKRDFAQLGFGFETGMRLWIGLAIAAAWCGLLITQWIALRRDPEKLQATAAQFKSVHEVIPHTDQEAKEFLALSITAGVCEEILYRGYLMVYVASTLAVGGMWLAILLSSLAFGLGHAYQGPKGVLKTGLIGLAMAGLYAATGSILPVIVVHAVMDLACGSIGREAIAVSEAVSEAD